MNAVRLNILSGSLFIMYFFGCPLETYGMIPQYSGDDTLQLKQFLQKDTVHLEIHGPSNDVAFYMNGLLFLSNSKYHRKMIPDHVTFGQEQTYFVPLEYISLESSRPLFENDPFPYPPGGMSFTREYRKVYFTKPIELSGRRKVEKIYEMEITGSGTSEQQQLPFCNDPSRYMHPAISEDGSMMVFSSDRIPSSGGLDLFLTKKTGDGWSDPVNLGRMINTSGHEWFPFLDHHGNLYFSSTGHGGFGGYDIFLCHFDGTGWGEPMNMSGFINSHQDELSFSIHPNKRLAVYSTSFGSDRSQSNVYLISLKQGAPIAAGAESRQHEDLALLLLDMTEPGAAAALLAEREKQYEEPAAEPPAVEKAAADEEEIPYRDEPAVEEQDEPAAEDREVPAAEEQEEPETDGVVFRVQVLSSMRPNTRPSLTIAGKEYDTFEYMYKGAYRITVGAFKEMGDALELRDICRRSGYDEAFVAAFRNNERVLDPSIFK